MFQAKHFYIYSLLILSTFLWVLIILTSSLILCLRKLKQQNKTKRNPQKPPNLQVAELRYEPRKHMYALEYHSFFFFSVFSFYHYLINRNSSCFQEANGKYGLDTDNANFEKPNKQRQLLNGGVGKYFGQC